MFLAKQGDGFKKIIRKFSIKKNQSEKFGENRSKQDLLSIIGQKTMKFWVIFEENLKKYEDIWKKLSKFAWEHREMRQPYRSHKEALPARAHKHKTICPSPRI